MAHKIGRDFEHGNTPLVSVGMEEENRLEDIMPESFDEFVSRLQSGDVPAELFEELGGIRECYGCGAPILRPESCVEAVLDFYGETPGFNADELANLFESRAGDLPGVEGAGPGGICQRCRTSKAETGPKEETPTAVNPEESVVPQGLAERYAAMDTMDLARIVTTGRSQYTIGAIRVATAELQSRGETEQTLVRFKQEAGEEDINERKTEETTPEECVVPQDLAERYAAMDTADLAKIITSGRNQYSAGAIRVATAELQSRGETEETLARFKQEAAEEDISERKTVEVNGHSTTGDDSFPKVKYLKLRRFGLCFLAAFILHLYCDQATSMRLCYYLPIGMVMMCSYVLLVVTKFHRVYPHPSRPLGNFFFTFLYIVGTSLVRVSTFVNSIKSGKINLSDSAINMIASEYAKVSIAGEMGLLCAIVYIILKLRPRWNVPG